MIRYYFHKLGKNERGAAMIEFALVALLLFILLFGIVEFGWIFFGWITLTGAVREGVRLAVVGGESDRGTIVQTVERHALAFNVKEVNIIPDGSIYDGTVTVEAIGDLPLLTGLFPISNPYTLTAEATMRKEFGGSFNQSSNSNQQ